MAGVGESLAVLLRADDAGGAAASAGAGGGRIINILASTVYTPIPNLALSAATRMGVIGFMKNLSDDIGPREHTHQQCVPRQHHVGADDGKQ